MPANGFFSEGICTYFDGTDTDRRRHAISLHYELKNRIDLRAWYRHFPSEYYPLAGSFIQYLTEEYSWKKVLKFLKSLKGPRALTKVFQETFSVDLNTTEQDWRNWLGMTENK